MPRIALCLLLVCLSSAAGAREMRLQAGSDDGSCPEITAAVAEAEGPASKPRAAAPAASRTKASKPAAGRSTGDSQRVQAPRWHSFLPGMFR
jgi:hypothetical protein